MVIILISAFHNLSWPKSGFVQPNYLNALFLSFWPWVHKILNQKFVKLFVSLKADFAVKTSCKHSHQFCIWVCSFQFTPAAHVSIKTTCYEQIWCLQRLTNWKPMMQSWGTSGRIQHMEVRFWWTIIALPTVSRCLQGPRYVKLPSVYHTVIQKNQNTMRKAIPTCCNHAEDR